MIDSTPEHYDLAELRKLFANGSSNENATALNHIGSCSACLSVVHEAPAEVRARFLGLIDQQLIAQQPDDLYREALDRASERVRSVAVRLSTDRATSLRLVESLLRLSPERRLLLINNSRRYRSLSVARSLADTCRERWASATDDAIELVQLGLSITDRLEQFEFALVADLKARCWSYLGNCLRIKNDLDGAELAHRHVAALLEDGTGDILERADFLELHASLRRDQRRFRDASECIGEAIQLYKEANDPHLEGRAHLIAALNDEVAGEVQTSLKHLRLAAGLIDSDREPRLVMVANTNLLWCLLETGAALEAKQRLPQTLALVRAFGHQHDHFRGIWLRGAIYDRLNQEAAAVLDYRQAHDGFVEIGALATSARVALDLAALFLRQGDTQSTKKLAEGMVPIFSKQGIHRETLSALALFQQAAAREQASVGLVEDLIGYLKAAQSEPGLRFVYAPKR